jgi:hypothetical protein
MLAWLLAFGFSVELAKAEVQQEYMNVRYLNRRLAMPPASHRLGLSGV